MGAKTLKGKLKKKNKYLSIMIIPENKAAARVHSFSAHYSIIFLTVGFVMLALIITSTVLVGSVRQNRMLKNSVALLTQQNVRQIDLLSDKYEEIGSLKEKEFQNDSRIGSFLDKIKDMTNSYISGRTESTIASRSGSRNDATFVTDLRELKEILNELKELNSEEIDFDFSDVEAELTDYLDHMPTSWPLLGRISSSFGDRQHPVWYTRRPHEGLDIAASYGQDIASAASGVVTFAGYNSSYGYHVIIDHGNGLSTLYAHASRLLVKAGLSINRGDIIAKAGSSGVSTGPHLHFEIRLGGIATDPMNYLDPLN